MKITDVSKMEKEIHVHVVIAILTDELEEKQSAHQDECALGISTETTHGALISATRLK